MPVYPDFPTLASAKFRHSDPTYEHPNYTLKYENGVTDSRAITSTGRWSRMPVSIVVSTAVNADFSNDFQTLMEFFQARKLGVDLFYYTHPFLGRGLCKYNSQDGNDKITPHIEINGNPMWFRFDLILEGQFNA
jgi:hypothetical protein